MTIALSQCPGALNQVDIFFACLLYKEIEGQFTWYAFPIMANVKCSPEGVKHPGDSLVMKCWVFNRL